MTSALGQIREDRFPLTLIVYLAEDGREIHRDTITSSAAIDLRAVAPRLDAEHPGRKDFVLLDKDGQAVYGR